MTSPQRFQIILVCTGNICRSPMAEGLLRDSLSEKTLAVTVVSSAGTAALAGLPASENSIIACAEAGIDISSHRSRPLSRRLIEESDLILTMEDHHVTIARHLAPDLADRIHLLARYGTDADDVEAVGVADPLGGSLEEYRTSFEEIQRQLVGARAKLEREILAGVVES